MELCGRLLLPLANWVAEQSDTYQTHPILTHRQKTDMSQNLNYITSSGTEIPIANVQCG
jgi:hypothetical protein